MSGLHQQKSLLIYRSLTVLCANPATTNFRVWMETKRKGKTREGHMEAGSTTQHLLKWPSVNNRHSNSNWIWNQSWLRFQTWSRQGVSHLPLCVHVSGEVRDTRTPDSWEWDLWCKAEVSTNAWNRLELCRGVQILVWRQSTSTVWTKNFLF